MLIVLIVECKYPSISENVRIVAEWSFNRPTIQPLRQKSVVRKSIHIKFFLHFTKGSWCDS